MNLSIEKSSLENLEDIVNFNYDIFERMYQDEPYSLEHYKEKLKDKDKVIFLAKMDDKIIGDSISFKRGNSFYIWILGVDKKYRGKGIGNLLLEKNEKFAKENSYESVSVKVYNVSDSMQSILNKRGYKMIKIEENKTDSKYNIVWFELKLKV